jgi:hypothetical protein
VSTYVVTATTGTVAVDAEHVTVIDGCLLLLTPDGDTVAWAHGKWSLIHPEGALGIAPGYWGSR